MIYPRYINELRYVRKLREIETVETSTIINETMPKYYDYIVAAQLVEKPYTAPPAVTTANISIYFNKNTVGEPRNASRNGNTIRERVESEFKVFCNTADAQTAIKNEDVFTWYKERQLQFSMLSHLATIIFQYLPLKMKMRDVN